MFDFVIYVYLVLFFFCHFGDYVCVIICVHFVNYVLFHAFYFHWAFGLLLILIYLTRTLSSLVSETLRVNLRT